MDHGTGAGRRELPEGNGKKVSADLLEYLEWVFWNGEHLPFLQKLRDQGRETALDQLPELDEDGQALWQMYCFTGEDILMSVDVYEKRIGIPTDWEFEECVLLISDLKKRALELQRLKRGDGRHDNTQH